MLDRWSRSLLLLVTALAGLLVAASVPLSYPMPGYFKDTVEWAASGRIADTFTPLAYPLFLGPAYRLAGVHGIFGLQLFLQLALALVSYQLLRQLRLSSKGSALGAALVALHPILIASITKVWDVGLSTFLLLLLVLLSVRLQQASQPSLWTLEAALGPVFAAAVFCRPNYLFFLPVLLVLLLRRKGLTSIAASATVLFVLLVSSASYCLFAYAAHGSVFTPRNGPYNLYAGHNEKSVHILLTDLNAESALVLNVRELHPGEPNPDFNSPSTDAFYSRQAKLFALHHPGTELLLVPVKLLTLFRPDTKLHPLLSPGGLAQLIFALPVVLFLALLVLPGRPRLQPFDRLLFFFEAIYILPFLITNSDPRFRTPLDALLLLHAASLLYRRLVVDSVVNLPYPLSFPLREE